MSFQDILANLLARQGFEFDCDFEKELEMEFNKETGRWEWNNEQ